MTNKLKTITTEDIVVMTPEERIEQLKEQIKAIREQINKIENEEKEKLVKKVIELASMKNEFGRKVYTYSEVGSKVGKSAAYVSKVMKDNK